MIWTTPPAMFDALLDKYGFTVDLCADPDNNKLPHFYLRDESLSRDWDESGFLNPPFGRNVIDSWLAKAREDAARFKVRHVVVFPSRTSSPWFHDTILNCTYLVFVKHKRAFIPAVPQKKNGVPTWGVAVAVFDSGIEFDGHPICEGWDY